MLYIPAQNRGAIFAFDRGAAQYKRLDLNDTITILGGATHTCSSALLREANVNGFKSDLLMTSLN